MNENHDEKGRFASGGGGLSGAMNKLSAARVSGAPKHVVVAAYNEAKVAAAKSGNTFAQKSLDAQAKKIMRMK